MPKNFSKCARVWNLYWRCFIFGCVVSLAACSTRVELLSSVSDSEANEVLSALLESGIHAEKVINKAVVSVFVAADNVERALEILQKKGLPRERFDGMGQVFRKEGLVSSPLEERARYIYALSQELANTLSQMDGVLVARVHVVLPERGGVGETLTPSTAAVFLKHQPNINLDALQPQIRRLVMYSIPGLAEDRVSISLVSAQPQALSQLPKTMTSILGIEVASDSATALSAWLAISMILILGLMAVLGYVGWRYMWPIYQNSAVPKPTSVSATKHEPDVMPGSAP